MPEPQQPRGVARKGLVAGAIATAVALALTALAFPPLSATDVVASVATGVGTLLAVR